MRGRFHVWIHELHQQYGPVVRYSPDSLSSINPETWKEVYGHNVPQWPKDPYFFGPDPYGEPVGILRAGDQAHGRQRKLVSHAFSDRALNDQEGILKKYVSLLVDKVQQEAEKNGGIVDLVAWFNFTTFDIMADLTFGESLNQLAGAMYSPWVKSIFGHVQAIHRIAIYMQWQPLTKLLMWFVPKHIMAERKDVQRFATERVEHRLNSEVERPDIWSYILRYSNNEAKKDQGLAHNEMLSNGSTFMAAGTETTATLLSGFFYYLLRDAERHQRLVQEVRAAFLTFEDMTMPRLAELKYLQACLQEALRAYPPVSIGIPRVAPKERSKLGDGFVPKGVSSNRRLRRLHANRNRLEFKCLNSQPMSRRITSRTQVLMCLSDGCLKAKQSTAPTKRKLCSRSRGDLGTVLAKSMSHSYSRSIGG